MLVEHDIRPQQTTYYTAALVLAATRKLPTKQFDLAAIYAEVSSSYPETSLDSVILGLDYLFLLGLVQISEEDLVCS